MNYESTYQAIYAVIFNDNNRIIGSGVAVDKGHVLTCAHVVNAALKLKLDSAVDQTGKMLFIGLPLNTVLSENDRRGTATVVKWIPKDKLELKSDLALLRINEPVIISALQQSDGDIEFVGSPVTSNHQYKMIAYDTSSVDQSSMELFGTVGSYLASEGKTLVIPGDIDAPFIQSGVSGSPVFSATLNGIIGIVQGLKTFNLQPNTKTGFIIDSRAITQSIADIQVKPRGFGYYGEEKKALRTSYLRKYGKHMCDRREMVQSIYTEIRKSPTTPVCSFVYTDYTRQEDSHDLLIRYKSEFFDPELHERAFFHVLRIPDIANLTLFRGAIFGDLLENLTDGYSPAPSFAGQSFSELLAENGIGASTPVLCMVECDLDKMTHLHIQCLRWLYSEFLGINQPTQRQLDLHILFVGRFATGPVTDKLQLLRQVCNAGEFISLQDVSTHEINKWVDRYIADQFRSDIRKRFTEYQYPMREIYQAYDELNKRFLI